MDLQTFNKAARLRKKYEDLEQALVLLDLNNSSGVDEGTPANPSLIIEFDRDDGGRGQQPIPLNLTDIIFSCLKSEIRKEMAAVTAAFENL